MVPSSSLSLLLAPEQAVPYLCMISLLCHGPLGQSVSSVSPSSGRQYVPTKVRSGRACSCLSEVSMEGRESRKTHWSPASTHHGELLLILIFSATPPSLGRILFQRCFAWTYWNLFPEELLGQEGHQAFPRGGGHGSVLRFCLKTCAREQREAVGAEKSQATWSVRWSSQERAFPALSFQPSQYWKHPESLCYYYSCPPGKWGTLNSPGNGVFIIRWYGCTWYGLSQGLWRHAGTRGLLG